MKRVLGGLYDKDKNMGFLENSHVSMQTDYNKNDVNINIIDLVTGFSNEPFKNNEGGVIVINNVWKGWEQHIDDNQFTVAQLTRSPDAHKENHENTGGGSQRLMDLSTNELGMDVREDVQYEGIGMGEEVVKETPEDH